jgi:hypothetical protein
MFLRPSHLPVARILRSRAPRNFATSDASASRRGTRQGCRKQSGRCRAPGGTGGPSPAPRCRARTGWPSRPELPARHFPRCEPAWRRSRAAHARDQQRPIPQRHRTSWARTALSGARKVAEGHRGDDAGEGPRSSTMALARNLRSACALKVDLIVVRRTGAGCRHRVSGPTSPSAQRLRVGSPTGVTQ